MEPRTRLRCHPREQDPSHPRPRSVIPALAAGISLRSAQSPAPAPLPPTRARSVTPAPQIRHTRACRGYLAAFCTQAPSSLPASSLTISATPFRHSRAPRRHCCGRQEPAQCAQDLPTSNARRRRRSGLGEAVGMLRRVPNAGDRLDSCLRRNDGKGRARPQSSDCPVNSGRSIQVSSQCLISGVRYRS